MTVLTPEERFANHKAGTKAAWVVKRYGLRLLPELYDQLNPMPYLPLFRGPRPCHVQHLNLVFLDEPNQHQSR